MTIKKVASVTELASILRTIFLFHKKENLPMKILDPDRQYICVIQNNDETQWIKTPYNDSFAYTKKLCTKQEWDRMPIAKQVELCDCWEALAIFEYLHKSYDSGNRFHIQDYEC